MNLDFFVPGLPVSQPRTKAARCGSFIRVYTPKTADTWKASVIAAAQETMTAKFEGAVNLVLTFILPRPQSHYGSGKNSGAVRASAPKLPTPKPDLDNFEKAVMDACTSAGVWIDDSYVTTKLTKKRYLQPGGRIGCRVSATEDSE